jgi:hypothetical protein
MDEDPPGDIEKKRIRSWYDMHESGMHRSIATSKQRKTPQYQAEQLLSLVPAKLTSVAAT